MSSPEKFCTACQTYRSLDFGEFFIRNKIKRWICKVCQERQNESIYASKRRDEKAKQGIQAKTDQDTND
jgi:hypothetical protein